VSSGGKTFPHANYRFGRSTSVAAAVQQSALLLAGFRQSRRGVHQRQILFESISLLVVTASQ
jgi:hypothetical protein